MEKKSYSILLLRTLHALFALYFIVCIVFLYRTLFTLQIDAFFFISIASLAVEGFLVFIVNKGHCPLAPLQKKLNDPVPFFNLFLPDSLAKKAIPFFTFITFFGIFLLILRVILKI